MSEPLCVLFLTTIIFLIILECHLPSKKDTSKQINTFPKISSTFAITLITCFVVTYIHRLPLFVYTDLEILIFKIPEFLFGAIVGGLFIAFTLIFIFGFKKYGIKAILCDNNAETIPLQTRLPLFVIGSTLFTIITYMLLAHTPSILNIHGFIVFICHVLSSIIYFLFLGFVWRFLLYLDSDSPDVQQTKGLSD